MQSDVFAFVACVVVSLVGCSKRTDDPAPVPATPSANAKPSAPPVDSFLEVAPDRWNVRPASYVEETPAPVARWLTVAFDVAVPSLGDLRVSVVNRASASAPLEPTLAPQDEHHVFDGSMSVHPRRVIRVRVAFETWRGSKAPLTAWVQSLVPADAGAAHAGAMVVVVDDQVANAAGGRVDSRAPIPIEAAPKPDFNHSDTAIGGMVTKKVGEEIALARWTWAPPLTSTGTLEDLNPKARLLGPEGWVPPEKYPHPTWLLRLSFTPSVH